MYIFSEALNATICFIVNIRLTNGTYTKIKYPFGFFFSLQKRSIMTYCIAFMQEPTFSLVVIAQLRPSDSSLTAD